MYLVVTTESHYLIYSNILLIAYNLLLFLQRFHNTNPLTNINTLICFPQILQTTV